MVPSLRWQRRRSSSGAQTPAKLALAGSGAGKMHAGSDSSSFSLLFCLFVLRLGSDFSFSVYLQSEEGYRSHIVEHQRCGEMREAESVSNKIFVQLRKICSFVRSLSSMSTKMTTMSGMLNENSRTKQSDASVRVATATDTKGIREKCISLFIFLTVVRMCFPAFFLSLSHSLRPLSQASSHSF